jgi:hypothetical protein
MRVSIEAVQQLHESTEFPTEVKEVLAMFAQYPPYYPYGPYDPNGTRQSLRNVL